jgi:CRISPR-associated endonuclease/helicase Cas3
MMLDVAFPVRGDRLAAEHHYPLLGALCDVVPEFHVEGAEIRFAPINGERGERGTIRLSPRSRLRVRVPTDRIVLVLPLAGRTLHVGDHRVTLGTPTVAPLAPAPTLAARTVTFKNSTDPEQFLTVARRKLDELGVSGQPGIPLIREGERAGEPRRKVLRIKGRRIVGYSLQVEGLTAEESLLLQEKGLGGRCRMGCGFFLPVQPRSS